ncbi:conserved hypothetical protein [Tenacibaculum maritimum]|uniref:DUF6503 family protein n=1 Tax=Tenacibaculum maritimum TaxID=107401 RepID=UPI0012E591A5|nr:DUF6503 family protein [Tenacibaculum maritimum]CAA0149565.1 conserved hypothetical protein [Tenacibaculum maritimum]CAA0243623.1 conserved hypothetical protein [Tenacibaculum maritimum]
MRYFFLFITMYFGLYKTDYTAQEIIDKSIEKSGLQVMSNATLAFTFRDKHYKAVRKGGHFNLSKSFVKDGVKIEDILSNSGLQRFIGGKEVSLNEKAQNAYANSVNSVHYFAVLPYGLNDKAVYKKLLPEVTIKGKAYYKIEITFNENGGGDDFDDVFIYWIDKKTFKVTYLAYKYHTNGGGIRFRDVKKEHLIKGVRLVDYNNYKPLKKDLNFYDIDKEYENNKLKKLSEIVLENISITY